jgi:ATP-dependent protease Clp ATPase subunit
MYLLPSQKNIEKVVIDASSVEGAEPKLVYKSTSSAA